MILKVHGKHKNSNIFQTMFWRYSKCPCAYIRQKIKKVLVKAISMHIRGKLWRLGKKNLALRVLRGKRVLLLRFQNPYSKFRSVAIMIFKAGRKAQGLRWCCFIAVDKMFNNVQHLSTLLFYILLFKYSKHGVLCVCPGRNCKSSVNFTLSSAEWKLVPRRVDSRVSLLFP